MSDIVHCGKKELKFVVEGEPVSQGRPRFTRFGKPYEEKKCTEAKEKIKEIAESEMYNQGYTIAVAGMPVVLSCVFYLPIPSNKRKWWKVAAELGMIAPSVKKKDVDNCFKLVSDAINGVCYHDDSQIVEIHGVAKYSDDPRTEVTVEAYYTNVGDVMDEAKKRLQ